MSSSGPTCATSCSAWPSNLITYPGCEVGDLSCICSKIDVNAILKCCANDKNGQVYVQTYFGTLCGTDGMLTYSSFGPSATAAPSSGSVGGASASFAASSPTAISNNAPSTSSISSGSSGSSGNSSSLSTATIAGIAIGGAVAGALVIAALGFFCFRARRRRTQQLQQVQYPPASFSTLPPPQHPGYVIASPQATSIAPTLMTAPSSTVTPLNPQNLNQHLASQEWAGLQRPVQQKQTANQSMVEEVLPDGPSDGRTEWSGYGSGTGSGSQRYGDGVSVVSELRPQDAVGEPGRGSRYGSGGGRPPATVSGGSRVFSDDPRTAIYPASESIWPTRV